MTDRLPSLSTHATRPARDILRIAHRALELLGPDAETACNSVRSAGAHLVEVDARVTRDGALVVAHDPWVVDGDRRRWISDLPAAAVIDADPSVASLSTALRAIRSCGLGLYLDIKSIDRPSGQWLGRELAETDLNHTSIMASSRSDVVALCAQTIPDVPRAVLFASDTEDPLQLAASVSAQFVHPCWERFGAPHLMLAPEWVHRVRAAGLGIITWHEERPEVLSELVALGVDGICTDNMSLLSATADRATASADRPRGQR